MRRWFFPLCIALAVLASLLLFGRAHAQSFDLQKQINAQINAGVAGAAMPAPTNIRLIVPEVIKVLLEIIGSFFMILILLGGWGYINAKGDETQVEKAKETIKGAIIGLIIIMIAYSITLFVTIKFSAAVNQGGIVDQNYNPSVNGR